MFKYRRVLTTYLEEIAGTHAYRLPFQKLFGYWPEGLEYSDVGVLKLSPKSRIGKDNRLLVSKTRYAYKDKPSMIFLGDNCWTGRNVEINIMPGTQVVIKSYSTIQDDCKIIGDVAIEKYCLFAPSVFVSSGNHYAVKDNPDIIRNQDEHHLNDLDLFNVHSKRVHIDEDCWIGKGAFIRQGVYLGRGVVVGANAIVTRDVMPYSIVAGNNKVINSRFTFLPPTIISASKANHAPYFYRGFAHKKGEFENKADGYFILEPGSGIVMLQKGTVRLLRISGKIIQRNAGDTISLSILYNGRFKYESIIEGETGSRFMIEVNEPDFMPVIEPGGDAVWRLVNDFNIFQLSYSAQLLPTEKEKCNLLAFDFFEEKMVEH